MKTTLFALLLVLCAQQLQAALGETETELVKRYGKVQGSFLSETGKFTTDEFNYGVYHVSVTLLSGQSSREIFTRNDKKPLNPVEMQTFLDANALGSSWEKKDDNASVIVWVLVSKDAFAGYYKELNSLIIKTPDMLAMELALMQIQQQQQQQPQPTPDPTKNRNLRP